MKIYLYFIGKPKDAHANAIAADFLGRAARYSACEMREIRPDRIDLWGKHPSARKIFLDPAGKPLDSAGFARLIAKASEASQIIVVSHATSLVSALQEVGARQIVLEKQLGETVVPDQERPAWNWPSR